MTDRKIGKRSHAPCFAEVAIAVATEELIARLHGQAATRAIELRAIVSRDVDALHFAFAFPKAHFPHLPPAYVRAVATRHCAHSTHASVFDSCSA